MPAWLRTWVSFAATAWPVGIVLLFVHQAVGHGLVAELTGGRFLALYLSPVAGYADIFAGPGALSLLALGAAAPLTAAVGFVAWSRTRRSTHFLPRVAGWYFGLGATLNLLSIGCFPWIAARTRGIEGDWGEIWRAAGVPPTVPGLIALALLAPLAAIAILDAQRLVTVHHPSPGRRSLAGSYWLLISAAAVPAIGYAAAFWPFWRPRDITFLAVVLGLALAAWVIGSFAVPIARRRGWSALEEPAGAPGIGLRMPDAPTTVLWIAMLLLSTLGVAWLFGPATRARDGMAIRALTPDDYFSLDSRTDVEWSFDVDGAGRLIVRSSPPVSSDSGFEERRAGEADRLGPSQAACDDLLRSVAADVEGVTVEAATAPDRSQGAWRCAAPIRAERRGISVIIPRRAAALTITAPGLATRRYSAEGVGLALSAGTARWVRPEGFRGTDAVRVKF